jgi:hypothetical protein
METIKQPDLNAPRFRPTRTALLNLSFFRKFRRKHPQYKEYTDPQLRAIINEHSTLMWNTAVDNRDGIELPENLGFVFIGTCTPSKTKHNTDYATSLTYNKRLKHRNFESDNYIAKIFYTNYAAKYKFRNRELWQLKGERDFTRTVSEKYPENWNRYVKVESFELINRLYRKSKGRDYYAKKLEKDLQDYNEFDMD